MKLSPYGDYVLAEDYDALRADLELERTVAVNRESQIAGLSRERDQLRAERDELTATLEAVRGSIEGLITLWFATREHGCLPVAVIKATAAVKIIDAALATTTSMEQSHE